MSRATAARRGLVSIAASLLGALSGCGGGRTVPMHAGRGNAQLGRAIATAPARTGSIATGAPRTLTSAGRRALLAVAGRFAAAYVRYQTAHLTAAVAAGIRSTSTRALARFLLSQPVSVPAGQHIAQERVARVTVRSRSEADMRWAAVNPPTGQPQSGTVQITLARDHGRWVVAAAKPLL
jgi:hypothetical protein